MIKAAMFANPLNTCNI